MTIKLRNMDMFKGVQPTLNLESIASKLAYFQLQIQFNHWITTNEAEHEALGDLYEYIQDFKDDVVEKLMGYMEIRIKPYKMEAIAAIPSIALVKSLCDWAYSLYEWAGENDYCDVENLAQELSGKAAKTKYLLTLS